MKNFHYTSFLFMLFIWCGSPAICQDESVTISGRVTDFENRTIDSCSVIWQNERFETLFETLTDSNGYYSIRIPKGVYPSMAAIRMNTYPNSKILNVDDQKQRLEYWGWNFIVDRDTICDLRYHRMEAYGLHVFNIPGAAPTYQIYIRPIGLSRFQNWMKQGMPSNASWSPSQDSLKIVISIDGEEVPILMQQELKEYFSDNSYGKAFLLTVPMPKKRPDLPYRIFKVELSDLEYGDQGEGTYYLEL